jgi:hypothetical protein
LFSRPGAGYAPGVVDVILTATEPCLDDERPSAQDALDPYCTECGAAEPATGKAAILVRDTTDRDGVTLSVPADAWQRFTTSLR